MLDGRLRFSLRRHDSGSAECECSGRQSGDDATEHECLSVVQQDGVSTRTRRDVATPGDN